MLRVPPTWTIDRSVSKQLWPGGARLCDNLVVSEWCSLDRTDGSVVWERPSLPRVNHIAGFHDGILQFVPCRNYLVTLDALTGTLVQELDLGIWTGFADFGGVDERGAVVRIEQRRVVYLGTQDAGE